MDSCFVTGTDTGVGKTLIAAALVHALARAGRRAVGMKPVAAGAEWRDGALRNEDVEALIAAANVVAPREAVCPVLLPQAVAPHIAAESAGIRIALRPIEAAFATLRAQSDAVVVEGVGGFRVPLAPDFDTADLACFLGLPVVLVVGLRLGCLNHALLSAEAIAARGLRLQAWVANRIDPAMAEAERNLATLRRLLPAPCMGVVPHLARVDFREVADRLDIGVITG
ncbi:dethiobiotin synthase [Burkholderiales bacterium GJ-E10]|nr:dethiobiotin synthase [Burkholderiales bacterium GJ-E10]